METRSHVGSKMRRAGIVTLFAAGLAFTGIAPANALEGEPVQNGDNSRPGITAVARVEVPHVAQYKDKNGASTSGAAVDVCTGVLIDNRHIATMKSCVTNANGKPYDFSMSAKAGGDAEAEVPPPRVTFGSEVIPGAGPNNVFWISSISFDPKAATQVAIARLDRDVPEKIATPVKIVDSGVNGNMSGETGTMFGWRPEGGVPRVAYQETRLPITKLVNDTVTMPRSKVQQWNQWRESHPSFTDDKDLGTIAWDKVRKGWEDPEGIVVLPEDNGAPVISADGKKLIGIHVGLGIILDAQQTDFATYLSKTRPAKTEEVMVPNPQSESAPIEALKIIQKSLCHDGVGSALPQPENGMDGQQVQITWGAAKNEAIVQGVGIDKRIKENPSFTDSSGVHQKSDLNLTATVVGKPRNKIEKVSAAGCTKADPGSIAQQLKKAEEDYAKIGDLMEERRKDEKEAQSAKDRYDDAVRELDEMKTQISTYNTPTAAEDFQTYHDYAGLPKWVREGIKYQDPDDNRKFCTDDQRAADTSNLCRQQITLVEKFIDPQRDDPEAGKKLKTWYDDAADSVEMRLKRLRGNQAEKNSALAEATKKVTNAQMNQSWAQKVLELAQKAQTDADNLATNTSKTGVEDKWQTEVFNRNKAFVEAYESWANDYFNAQKSQADAANAVKTQQDKVQAAQDALTAAEALPDTDPTKADVVKKATDKLNNEKSVLNDKQKQLTAVQKQLDNQQAKKPIETDEKYRPKIDKQSPKLADVAQKMPNYKLNVINARWTIAALVKGMDGSNLIDPSEKDKIAAQIGSYYDRAVGARPDIMRRQIKVGDMLTAARLALSTAPQALQPQLKILVSDLERHAARLDDAADTVNSAVDELKRLWDNARRATSVEDAKNYLLQAQTALGTVDDPIETSKKALEDATGTNTAIKGLLSGKSFEEIVEEQNMTPEEKAEKEKAEAAKREEELRKQLEEELKKKYGIGEDGKPNKPSKPNNGKTEEQKKKDEAKDAKRLEKALSKNTLRAEGSDRVLTSIAAWKMGNFPGDSIVLVDGNVAADGLSATPFAAGKKAPILLTTWKTGLEPALMDQIKASGKKNLYLIGGQVPMTPYDEFELRDAGVDIHRITGLDRYQTAVAVNRATEPLIGAAPKKPLNLYVADGIGFPDALVAGAAAGRTGGLMLLSQGNHLDPSTYSYISQLGQTRPLQITAVGGPAVQAVRNTPWPTTMSVNVTSIMGKDRYETAANLAAAQPGTTAAVLVTGEKFPDAISGGALAVDQNAALLLTRTKELPPSSYQALRRHGAEKTIVVGGKGAVSPKVAELINGAKMKNDASQVIEGTLAESSKLEAEKKAAEEKAKQEALDKVKDMIKDTDSLKDVMDQLGVTDLDALAQALGNKKP